jgi:hypothetical protein
MFTEFGHASADYADEWFSLQTRSSLSDANTMMLSQNKNYTSKSASKRKKTFLATAFSKNQTWNA